MTKISELIAANIPLAGTELIEVVQDGISKNAPASELGGASTGDTAWHEIGAAGEPTFTFGSNYGSTFATAGFRKDSEGYVQVKGLVTGVGAAGRTIFTLPVGYRPLADHIFTGQNNSSAGSGQARLDVRSNGEVVLVGAEAVSSWVSLSGIRFLGEQ